MNREFGSDYFSNYRISITEPDPNRIPTYIKPETIEIKRVGSEQVMVIGGQRGIDINI